MGSFNETCALSGLNIPPNTPVRLLFLTQNPYVNSDQRVGQRGCYHYDQWFVRTPPIKGTYDDYGRCKFTEGPITDLICECFQTDVVEQSFGFNQYHATDVTKSKGIHHFLEAAYQGRLLVQDSFVPPREMPAYFPTWQKIQTICKANNLPIQSESNESHGQAGYNAQNVIPGVVCVTFNSYDDNTDKLKTVQQLLTEYDSRIVYMFEDKRGKNDPCIIVVPKGAFDNHALFQDGTLIREIIETHPRLYRHSRQLPVLTVMIREDVWQTYCTIPGEPDVFAKEDKTVEFFFNAIEKSYTLAASDKLFLGEMGFQQSLVALPLETSPVTHLITASENNFVEKNELLQICAELARVEYIMSALCQPWHIPPLGHQTGNWDLNTRLLFDLARISRKEFDAVD